jgi:hypothetical protein
VNGPAVAAEGDVAAVAWFTRAQDQPRVLVSFSRDGGRAFDAPVRVDDGEALGRVDVVVLRGTALVAWLRGEGRRAKVMARLVSPDGRLGGPVVLGETSSGRSSGFPRMEPCAEGVAVAWTEVGERAVVKTAVLAPER